MKPEYLERKVWHLGTLYFLGSIERAPDGHPEELPTKLLKATKARLQGDRSSELSLDELKVLALDLLGYYSKQRLPVPKDMTMLIGLLMGMSEGQVKDPHQFLEARQAKGRPSNAGKARDIAFILDAMYWRKHGKPMPLRELWRQVAELLALPPKKSVTQASLRKWREEYVNMLDMKGVAKLD